MWELWCNCKQQKLQAWIPQGVVNSPFDRYTPLGGEVDAASLLSCWSHNRTGRLLSFFNRKAWQPGDMNFHFVKLTQLLKRCWLEGGFSIWIASWQRQTIGLCFCNPSAAVTVVWCFLESIPFKIETTKRKECPGHAPTASHTEAFRSVKEHIYVGQNLPRWKKPSQTVPTAALPLLRSAKMWGKIWETWSPTS